MSNFPFQIVFYPQIWLFNFQV